MSSLFGDLSERSAELSPDGIYRYTLTREWEDGRCVAWLMFNPSTADAEQDDPTIRKCVGFSKRWGYGRLVVVNLFAIRSADPKAVRRYGKVEHAIGPLNGYWMAEALSESREVICAWGCAQHHPAINHRISQVMETLKTYANLPLNCLGYRGDGHPRHPLMLAYTTPRETYEERFR